MREGGRSPAWSYLQLALSKNWGILVPAIMNMKDFVGMMLDIEKFMKSEKGAVKDPSELLAEWLRGESDIATGARIAAPIGNQ